MVADSVVGIDYPWPCDGSRDCDRHSATLPRGSRAANSCIRECRKGAESTPTGVDSGRNGLRAKAAFPSGIWRNVGRFVGHVVVWLAARRETSSMRYVSRRALLIGMAVGWTLALSARVQAETPGRTALWGYDPVSYFTAGRPEAGSAEFTFAFDDATYWFASEEHRKMFAAEPQRYAPQFKGFCTLSVARGLKVEADPEAWVIWNGKLYVFGSKDAVPEFKANPAEIADKANAAWRPLKTN